MSLHDPIYDWKQAEQFAADVLRSCGFRGARTTQSGADGGVDVRGPGVLAQVKHLHGAVGRPDVQKLRGARGDGSESLHFFSLSGYSAQAIAEAERLQVALWRYDTSRNVIPLNKLALDSLPEGGLATNARGSAPSAGSMVFGLAVMLLLWAAGALGLNTWAMWGEDVSVIEWIKSLGFVFVAIPVVLRIGYLILRA
jgi:hypothetical protein